MTYGRSQSDMQESVNKPQQSRSDADQQKLPSEEIQNELQELKNLVEKSYMYFRDNYGTYNRFRKFVYETSITDAERSINDMLGRNNLEFNVVPAYLSRLCGEFSKQEPGIEVSKDEGSQVPSETINVVEGHIRHILDDAAKTNVQYHTYRDGLSGGFAGLKVLTEYANAMSFRQVIKLRKQRFPTLCGYDPLAEAPHKGDGGYSFECFPKSKSDFKNEYPHVPIDDINFNGDSALGGFRWAFNNQREDIILVCRMFKKKKSRVKIMELVDGQVLTEKQYKKFLKEFKASGTIAVPPAIVGKPRWTSLTTICRYVFTQTMVCEYDETDFNELPDIFVDGDSVDLYDNDKGMCKQLTRPYAINAQGAQQLKNLGGQALATYLENLTAPKFIVKKEAIPQERSYLNALTDLQKANTIVVNSFKDNNPNHPIPEPIIPVQQQAAPPEITNSISMADQIIQNVLGSYDAALGINQNQLSGIAIVEAATQSQAAAMPFVVNYLAALNQAAVIIVDLIPKYYKTPTTIPVIDKEGKKSFVRINDKNDPNSIDMNYDSNSLHVKVTAGVNFAIQKSKALNQLIELCKAVPGFAAFIERKGLKLVIENLEIRGSDMLKDLAEEYQEEMQQVQAQQQEMQQNAMANDPRMLTAKTKAMDSQVNTVFKAKEVEFKTQELEMKKQVAEADMKASMAKSHAEEVRAAADLAMARMDMSHRHAKDSLELAHSVQESHKDREERRNEKENANEKSNEGNGKKD